LPELKREGIRIELLGDLSALPGTVKKAIEKAYSALQKNQQAQINIALNYGGRAEIVAAVKKMIESGVDPKQVSEELFPDYLYTKDLPSPDLLIRTGGEQRISNFLLWQAAYAELFFTETLWPDFTPEELEKILHEFGRRKRNFGR
jgi:undecaprenyl diphosphate synthase